MVSIQRSLRDEYPLVDCERPQPLDALNVMNTADPFFACVVDRTMLVTVPRQLT